MPWQSHLAAAFLQLQQARAHKATADAHLGYIKIPHVPHAMFGVLNPLLYFPSGAIYPAEGFPVWLRWISYIDPFTYAVHALKALLLKNTGFSGIYSDILILSGFSVVLVSLSVAFFKRQI